VSDDVLMLGLLLPVSSSWTAGRTIAGAAALAVKRINDDAGLLGGMRVEYTWSDVGCRPYKAVEGTLKFMADPKIDGIIGPGTLATCTSGEPCLRVGYRSDMTESGCVGCDDPCQATVRRPCALQNLRI
jgi:hypothetical protein